MTTLAAAALSAHGFQYLARQVLEWLMACAAVLSPTALCMARGQGHILHRCARLLRCDPVELRVPCGLSLPPRFLLPSASLMDLRS